MNRDEHTQRSLWKTRDLWLCTGIAGLLFVLVVFQSNAADPNRYGHSCLGWLVRRWLAAGSSFSHAWLLAPVSAFLVWRQREQLRSDTKQASRWGLLVVVLCLLLHITGYRAMLPRLNLFAFVGLLWSIPFYVFGWPVARRLAFPCAYLLLGIPYGFLDSLTFPLRLFGCKVSATILNGLDIACERTGTIISTPGLNGFRLNVADACSGLRYMIAITAVAALYAYLTKDRLWKRWVLFLAAPLLAVGGNVVRIVLIGIVAHMANPRIALGLYHDYSGYIVFAAVVIMMIALSLLMKPNYIKRLSEWKKANTKPAS